MNACANLVQRIIIALEGIIRHVVLDNDFLAKT
jgi:hypothetical protein